jgi:hypothetical protein
MIHEVGDSIIVAMDMYEKYKHEHENEVKS